MIYLDHNASTPLDPRVRAAMREAEDVFGNASSVHAAGQAARRLVEEARDAVARLIGGGRGTVVFTSGATEANALALRGAAAARPGRVVISGAEHPSVRENAARRRAGEAAVVRVDPDPSGELDPDRVLSAVGPDTALVSVMAASNEYGALHPIARIAEGLRERAPGVLLHTDAVQAAGRIPVDAEAWGVDLLSLSAHKMHGPKGAGALWVRRGVALEPLIAGGGQEKRLRSGTENTAAIAGFGAAAAAAASTGAREDAERIRGLRDRLEAGVLSSVPGARALAASVPRLPNTSAILFDGVAGESLLIALDLEGVAVSVGSACSSGTVSPSPALTALGLSREEAMRVVRFSLGRTTTDAEISRVLEILPGIVARVRDAALTPVEARP